MNTYAPFHSYFLLVLLFVCSCTQDPTQPNAMTDENMDEFGMISQDAFVISDVDLTMMDLNEDMMIVDLDIDMFYEPIDSIVYDPEHVLHVSIHIDETSWALLADQSRDGSAFTGPDCLSGPSISPFTWFIADVEVDGQSLPQSAIRKKGFYGSISFEKPSLKISFDRHIDDQSFQGVHGLTLNNARQDPSFIRQCLSYDLFNQAGIAAPKCQFARVWLNDEDLGIYVNVEPVKKNFLAQHFSNHDGWLYEGAISDFRSGWSATFQQKTRESDPNRDVIDRITRALEKPDNELMDALDEVIDLTQFITFWAVETLVSHWDGYAGNTNNFYVYQAEGDTRAQFIPWGVDGTFQGPYQLFEDRIAPASVNVSGMLARRLYLHPTSQMMYLERLAQLLPELLDLDIIEEKSNTFLDHIIEEISEDQRLSVFLAVEDVIEFVQQHKQRIIDELNDGPVSWDFPARERTLLCGEDAGRLQGTFTTTWGSWPAEDTFQTGESELSLNWFEQELELIASGAAIGLHDEIEGFAQLIIPMYTQEEELFFVSIAVDQRVVANQRSIDLSTVSVPSCYLLTFDPNTQEITLLATCNEGQVTFNQANMNLGDVVNGSIDLNLWSFNR